MELVCVNVWIVRKEENMKDFVYCMHFVPLALSKIVIGLFIGMKNVNTTTNNVNIQLV